MRLSEGLLFVFSVKFVHRPRLFKIWNAAEQNIIMIYFDSF